eukprot:scaffold92461_cov13-Prasinocladus_malaysianus.AAC.1
MSLAVHDLIWWDSGRGSVCGSSPFAPFRAVVLTCDPKHAQALQLPNRGDEVLADLVREFAALGQLEGEALDLAVDHLVREGVGVVDVAGDGRVPAGTSQRGDSP